MKLVCLPVIVLVVAVSQICWARCICDPSDRLCLDGCVNSARDCIKGCRDTLCFTDCINSHWPGTTFEQLNSEKLQVKDTSSDEEIHSSTILKQPDSITIDSTIGVDKFFDRNNKEIVSASPQYTSTKETNTMAVSNTGLHTVPLSDLPSFLDAPSISFTTVHTTITSLITITPAPSSSLMNNNIPHTISLGLRSTYINSTNLWVTLVMHLSTLCILI